MTKARAATGAIGYVPSILPWLRGYAGYGSVPGHGFGSVTGLEIDVRLDGFLY